MVTLPPPQCFITLAIKYFFLTSHLNFPRCFPCLCEILPQENPPAARGTGAGWNQKAPGAWEWQPAPHHMTGTFLRQMKLESSAVCLEVSLLFWLIWIWKYSILRPGAYLMEDNSAWSEQTGQSLAFVPAAVPDRKSVV